MLSYFEGWIHFHHSGKLVTAIRGSILELSMPFATPSYLQVVSRVYPNPFVHYRLPRVVLQQSVRCLQCACGFFKGGIPESLSKLSIRPNRFSRPSIYFALIPSQLCPQYVES